jgi:hypothetical protein
MELKSKVKRAGKSLVYRNPRRRASGRAVFRAASYNARIMGSWPVEYRNGFEVLSFGRSRPLAEARLQAVREKTALEPLAQGGEVLDR